MSLPNIRTVSTRSKFSVAGIGLLSLALLLTLNLAQNRQEIRSKASTAGINYIINPGCESSISGWESWQGTVSRSTYMPHSGSGVCKVSYTGGTWSYSIDDAGYSTVTNPVAGEVFKGTAWVRTDNAVGRDAYLALRLWNGSSQTTYDGPMVKLSTSWQQVSNTITVPAGTTAIDYYVIQNEPSSGHVFYADDLELRLVSGSTPNPTSPPSTGLEVTFGKTTQGSRIDTGNSWGLTCNRYTATATGTVKSMSAFVGEVDYSRKSYYMGIYADSNGLPTTLLGNTGTGQLTAYSWNTLPLTASVTSGMNYWLCYNSNTYDTYKNNLSQSDGSSKAVWLDQDPGSWPSYFGTPGATWYVNYALYATIVTTPQATATPRPLPTNTPVPLPTATPRPLPTNTPVPLPTPTIVYVTATPFPTSIPTAIPFVPTNTPMPSPTPVPGNTIVTFSLFLHGIGKGGDSVNPGAVGNLYPLRPQRDVTVDIYDVQNQLVVSQQGKITYNLGNGNFEGSVDLGNQFTTGIYTAKVKTDQYLRGLFSGIQTITNGSTVLFPNVTLVNGDANNDNQINIIDYNLLLGCYSDLLPATDCDAYRKTQTDLNDDGQVNQFDYNLFIRELTNIGGQ